MTEPVVFVTNRSPVHTYESAYKYGGGLRFITSGNYPIFKTTKLQDEIVEALALSQPDDFLLFSGSSFVSALCIAVWLERHGTCNALLYDRTKNQYILRVITKRELRTRIESVRDEYERSGRLP